jgi:hypothetical protein
VGHPRAGARRAAGLLPRWHMGQAMLGSLSTHLQHRVWEAQAPTPAMFLAGSRGLITETPVVQICSTTHHSRKTKQRGGYKRGRGTWKASRKKQKKEDSLLARFAPSTWKENIHSYKNSLLEYTRPEPTCTHPYGCVPPLLGIFDKFWSPKLQ